MRAALAELSRDTAGERITVTVDPAAVPGLQGSLQRVPVLVRLHSGVFDFTKARPDGGDLRFVAADDKTPLAYHIERFDPSAELALVWVDVPQVQAGAQQQIWLYYGNQEAKAAGDSTDAVEAASLADRVGEEFAAVVVDVPEGKDDGGALEVQLVDPPVLARAKGAAELGAEVTVRLTGVDLSTGKVHFEVA